MLCATVRHSSVSGPRHVMFPSGPWFYAPLGAPALLFFLLALTFSPIEAPHIPTSSSRKPPQLTPTSTNLAFLIASAPILTAGLYCNADIQQPLVREQRAAKPTLIPHQEHARLLQVSGPTHWLLFSVSKTFLFSLIQISPPLQLLLRHPRPLSTPLHLDTQHPTPTLKLTCARLSLPLQGESLKGGTQCREQSHPHTFETVPISTHSVSARLRISRKNYPVT